MSPLPAESMLSPMPESEIVEAPERALALRSTALRVDACAGLARVVLEQSFANDHDEPLHVTYRLPLAADAAVSGFRFRIGERVIEGEIDRRTKARERFERALASGQSAALLEQERTSLFSQEIGNIPPRAELRCEILLDQRLCWLDEGMWEWRFPLAAAPRYLGEPGRVADAHAQALRVSERLPVRASLEMAVRDVVSRGGAPESPSHPLACLPEGDGFHVALGSGNAAPLDRDLVVRWPVGDSTVRTRLDVAGPRRGLSDAHLLACIVPPRADAGMSPVARDLTVLLDTSGSMDGEPLAQAKKVVAAVIESLVDEDSFELLEFSWQPRRFHRERLRATAEHKRAALRWLGKLRASGSTEMHRAILDALQPLAPDRQQQVVLVTDGLIGFEQEIVGRVLELLPNGARLHTVGVGSAVNRSLTGAVARAGRGVEVLVGLGEDPEPAAHRLCARTRAPLVVELEVTGDAVLETVPARLPDLFAGAPVLVGVRVRPAGGELIVRGRTASGAWEERHALAPVAPDTGSEAIVTIFGREAVEDAELGLAAGGRPKTIDETVERLGLAYRIATRVTSWIAVDSVASVDPREPSRRAELPQALPYGMSAEGLGLRAPSSAARSVGMGDAVLGALGSAVSARAFAPMAKLVLADSASEYSPRRPAEALQGALRRAERELAEDKKVSRTRFLAERPARAPAKIKDWLGSAAHAIAGAARGRRVPGASAQSPRSLVGRVILREGRLIVVEVLLAEPLEWQPTNVTVRFAGSSKKRKATIAWDRTTSQGALSAGLVLRLALELEADPPTALPNLVALDCGPLALEIQL